MILTVANLKGGTSKTTSAAFLAHALAERGRRVLVVDADPQASITRWAEMAEWRLPVVGKATGRLHVELEEIVGDRFDAVVIDTPPTDKRVCCVSRGRAAAGWTFASPSRCRSSASVQLRRVPLPA